MDRGAGDGANGKVIGEGSEVGEERKMSALCNEVDKRKILLSVDVNEPRFCWASTFCFCLVLMCQCLGDETMGRRWLSVFPTVWLLY